MARTLGTGDMSCVLLAYPANSGCPKMGAQCRSLSVSLEASTWLANPPGSSSYGVLDVFARKT